MSQLWRTVGISVMLSIVAAGIHGEPDRSGVRGRAGALFREPEFQTELPEPQDPGREEETHGVGSGTGSREEGSTGPDYRGPPSAEEGPDGPGHRSGLGVPIRADNAVTRAFLWVLVGALVVALATAVVREASRYRRRQIVADSELAESPATRCLTISFDDIEALASEGRYAEAVHLLLANALERITRHGHLAKSLTSREILGRPELEPQREALSVLVETVERSWFGGLAVAPDEFERCRDAGERLAAPTRGGE